MSNEAQRLYGALSEKARERGEELVNHAIERDRLKAQRDALLKAAKQAIGFITYEPARNILLDAIAACKE